MKISTIEKLKILILAIITIILFIFVLYVFKKAIEPYPWVNVAI
jgi:cell division protein FtsL